MSTALIVGCSRLKAAQLRSGSMAARDAYVGRIFQQAKVVAESSGLPWFILSGWYGLMRPSAEIEWYDVAMTPMRPGESWDEAFAHITDADLALLRSADSVVVLAGEVYADAAEWMLDRPVERPLRGLFVGQQFRALRQMRITDRIMEAAA
jgi:hypothetical protein